MYHYDFHGSCIVTSGVDLMLIEYNSCVRFLYVLYVFSFLRSNFQCDERNCLCELHKGFSILATRDTQFSQELTLVMQTTHAQR